MSELDEIYLQEETYNDEWVPCDRLWCVDAEVFDKPIKYIRADLFEEQAKQLAATQKALDSAVEALKAISNRECDCRNSEWCNCSSAASDIATAALASISSKDKTND